MRPRKGSIVIMTENALENYGEKWRDVKMKIVATSDHFMPAAEFYAEGQPEGYHPGYDSAGYSENDPRRPKLYDLETLDGDEIPFSLYDWEIEYAE